MFPRAIDALRTGPSPRTRRAVGVSEGPALIFFQGGGDGGEEGQLGELLVGAFMGPEDHGRSRL